MGSGANVEVAIGASVKVGTGGRLMLGGGATAATGVCAPDCTGGKVGVATALPVESGIGTDVGTLAGEMVVRALAAVGAAVRPALGEACEFEASYPAATRTVVTLSMATTTQPIAAVERLVEPRIGECERIPRRSDIRNPRPKPTAAIERRPKDPFERKPNTKRPISR